jgi:hypothetical protein
MTSALRVLFGLIVRGKALFSLISERIWICVKESMHESSSVYIVGEIATNKGTKSLIV